MKKEYKTILVLISVAVAATCALPVMSIYLSDGESCTMLIRGYNLMEFSALGCVPLFAPLFIPAITLGSQTEAAKETMMLFLFAANMICYVHSFNAARTWLGSLNGSLRTFYPGMLLIPLAFSTIMVLSKVIKRPVYLDCMLLGDADNTLPLKEDNTNE